MAWLAETSAVIGASAAVDEGGLRMDFVAHESVEGTFPYRSYFAASDHRNFSARVLGAPAVLSVMEDYAAAPRSPSLSSIASAPAYRAILRSADDYMYRAMAKDDVKKASTAGFFGGVSYQSIFRAIFPHVNITHVREIKNSSIIDDLLKMEEKTISLNYKFGVVYCKENQTHENEMFGNEHGSHDFYRFMDCIGQRIRLKGFDGYRGGLDVKNDTTGLESYVSSFKNRNIMYHVSTLLPYSASNLQQIARKAQIGNDIGILIFRDGLSEQPFDPTCIVSHFPHYYVVVTKLPSDKYHISSFRKTDVPVINGESASYKSNKFSALKRRTRLAILEDLTSSFVSKERRLSLSGILRPSKPSKEKRRETVSMPPPSNSAGKRRLSVSNPEIPSATAAAVVESKLLSDHNRSEVIGSYGSNQLASISEVANVQSYPVLSQDSVRPYEHNIGSIEMAEKQRGIGSIEMLEKQKSDLQKRIEILEEENLHLKTCLEQRVDSELEEMIQKHADLKLKELRVKLMQALQFIETVVSDGFKVADEVRAILDYE